jgi:hypothetical protein
MRVASSCKENSTADEYHLVAIMPFDQPLEINDQLLEGIMRG